MNSSGFYLNVKDINSDNNLIYAPNFVKHNDFELYIDKKDSYEYPINNWYYFDSEEEAKAFFNIDDKKNNMLSTIIPHDNTSFLRMTNGE